MRENMVKGTRKARNDYKNYEWEGGVMELEEGE